VARIDITCVNQDNVPCVDLVPPEPMCQDPLDFLSFIYKSTSTCSDSSNQQDNDGAIICSDFAPLENEVTINCGSAVLVEPSTVSSGDEFLLSGSSGTTLPASITCNVTSQTGDLLQQNTVSTSGPLHLKEQYGSFSVESCNNQICLQFATLTYTVRNEGSHSMNVKSVTRTREGDVAVDLAPGLTQNPIMLGASATVQEDIEIDVCTTTNIVTFADVDAEPDDGPECDAFDQFDIVFSPACAMDVDLTCVESDTNEPCDTLQSIGSPPCDCPNSCATELTYVYTGDNCQGSDNDDAMLACNDPLVQPSDVFVTAMAGQTVLYNGTATEGQLITLSNNGGCIPNMVEITVTAPSDLNTVYQIVEFQPGCFEGGTRLTESFGAFDFSGYVCLDGSEEQCITDVTFEACVANEGTVPMVISDTSLELNDNLLDISQIQGQQLITGQIICVEDTVGISLCGEPSFEAIVTIEADDTSNEGCADTETVIFTPESRPTGSPTLSPVAQITQRPAPTPAPTANIVTVPRPVFVPKPKPKPKAYYKGKLYGKLLNHVDQDITFC